MPVSTRQPTPGSSNDALSVLQPQLHTLNTRKRSGSEAHEDSRDSKKKKITGDVSPHLSSLNGKDKKKKKRKRKKRTSVVITGAGQREQTRPTSTTLPLSSNKQKTIPSCEVDQIDMHNGIKMDEKKDGLIVSTPGKGKGRAKSESPILDFLLIPALPSHLPQPAASSSGSSNGVTPDSVSEIARLKEQLATQAKLLERQQANVVQLQQALTCQICLDLLYKPYALAPCGHITCYGCLVRWFTASQNPEIAGVAHDEGAEPAADNSENILDGVPARNGVFLRRRKNCPVCRAVVIDRPIEIWGIKGMVSSFARSGLGELPSTSQLPTLEESADLDPWRNLFRKAGSRHQHVYGAIPPIVEQEDGDRAQMGWYDAEDGGIRRCIDCYHEIWGGICTACHRLYPGHGGSDEDEDDDEMSDVDNNPFRFQFAAEFTDDEDEDIFGGDHEIWEGRGEIMQGENVSDSEDGEIDISYPYLPQPLAHFYAEYGALYPGARDLRADGVGRIEEVDDDEHEDSDYEGSFIDDGREDSHKDSDEEVDFVDDVRRPRLRRRVLLDEDDEDEIDQGPREMARHLGRGARLGRGVGVPDEHEHESDAGSDREIDDLDEEDDAESLVRHILRTSSRRQYLSSDEEDGW